MQTAWDAGLTRAADGSVGSIQEGVGPQPGGGGTGRKRPGPELAPRVHCASSIWPSSSVLLLTAVSLRIAHHVLPCPRATAYTVLSIRAHNCAHRAQPSSQG